MSRSISIITILSLILLTISPTHIASASITITSIQDKHGTIFDPETETAVYRDTIVIIGAGVTSGDTINAYWDTVGAAYQLNATTGYPDGSYEIWLDVPSTIIGDHYIWIKDVETGQTARSPAITVDPFIETDIDEGLPGDEVVISGHGFNDEEIITIDFGSILNVDTSPSIIESDEDGAWTATIEVPDITYTTYEIKAADETGITDAHIFKVGAAITLDLDEGPAGSIVTISGRGFTPDAVIDTIVSGMVKMDTSPSTGPFNLAAIDDLTATVSASEHFAYAVIVPSVPIGEYEITVNDGTRDASASFEVIGESFIEVDPFYGPPGSQIMVYGHNFTQYVGTTLEFTLGSEELSDSITVGADGSFEGTLQLPALTLNQLHILEAVDENGLSATTDVLIGVITMLLSDYQGYVGDEIQLSATGLRGTGLADDIYDVFFGEIEIYSDIPSQSAVSESFLVPEVPPGIYEVTLSDHGWGINISTEFQVDREISNEYWTLDLHVQSGQDYSDITCGVIQDGTQGFDEILGDQVAIPSPPAGVYAYFNNIDDPNVLIDTSKLSTNIHGPDYPNNWTFDVEMIGISGTTSITWDSLPIEAVPEGYSVVMITPDSHIDMQSVNEYSWSGSEGATYSFKILVSEIVTQTMSLTSGWNLVSFSVDLLTPSTSSTLSQLEYYLVYTWNGFEYETVDSFEVGVGYWILVLQDTQIDFSGYRLGGYTYTLEPGWSQIGCYDTVSFDIDSHISGYYQIASWDGHGYDASSTVIQPLEGYWVLVLDYTEFNVPI